MIELIIIIKNETDIDFLKRLYDVANAGYLHNERWLLVKIKHMIKTRLG